MAVAMVRARVHPEHAAEYFEEADQMARLARAPEPFSWLADGW